VIKDSYDIGIRPWDDPAYVVEVAYYRMLGWLGRYPGHLDYPDEYGEQQHDPRCPCMVDWSALDLD
jgi:hypothetical protein